MVDDYMNSRGDTAFQNVYDYGQVLISNLIQSFDVIALAFSHL